jgi:hypothetical protein
MANARTPVPTQVSVEVLFAQNHTCCVCRERGKTVQLHHIDEDPTNHSPENLAVLCLEDHERTQVRGGFGKKLLAPEIKLYRNDWIERVKKRREEADNIAIAAMGDASTIQANSANNEDSDEWKPPPFAQLVAYIEHLPTLRRVAYENARRGWDTGGTYKMRHATSEVIDTFERVLVYLAAWYPPRHFNGQDAAQYFSEFIAARYQWHWALQEPSGPGSGGTIVGVLAGGDTLEDVSTAVVDMVEALSAGDVNLVKWRKAWEAAAQRAVSARDHLSALWNRFTRP